MARLLSRRRALAGATGALAGAATRASGQSPRRVDLELILAVDCSQSIDESEFRLQNEGTASAFTDAAVLRAATGGEHRAIAVAYVHWAGPQEQRVAVPWTLIGDQQAAYRFSDRIRLQPRSFHGDATSIGVAVDFARQLFQRSPFRGTRRTVDISSDGINNAGRFPARARDDAVDDGVTINALPILSEFAGLDGYFRDEVIGGAGAFVLPAPDYGSFAQAIRAKLIREIA